MSKKVNIHRTFRQYTDDRGIVEVEGDNVGACLDDLIGQFPGMKELLFDNDGKLKNVIEVYVNGETAYPDELARQVRDGDEIHLLVMLAGG
ncbi:MAG: MoaD/ThiS family protein [Deltaproteobacteria bacterium]|nr:MoaD/ThiS family protein [Deltaproteobacteria bacterium]